MTRKPVLIEQPEPEEVLKPAAEKSSWTEAELIAVYRLGYGPGIIGKEMFDAAQKYGKSSANGILGPATRGE